MMTEREMSTRTDDLDRRVKARWPRGWGCLLRQHEQWVTLIYDNALNATQFSSSSAAAALDQAFAHLESNPPMTEERLASILGIETAA